MNETNNRFLRLSKEDSNTIDKICKADSLFLKEKGLMDYSLLLVIESIPITDVAPLSVTGEEMTSLNQETIKDFRQI